jgi:hypothetical protein
VKPTPNLDITLALDWLCKPHVDLEHGSMIKTLALQNACDVRKGIGELLLDGIREVSLLIHPHLTGDREYVAAGRNHCEMMVASNRRSEVGRVLSFNHDLKLLNGR